MNDRCKVSVTVGYRVIVSQRVIVFVSGGNIVGLDMVRIRDRVNCRSMVMVCSSGNVSGRVRITFGFIINVDGTLQEL